MVDQKTWEKVREKRSITGFKSPSRVGRERIHLLTGLLKCPKCGSPMYCNRHSWQKKDGTYKDVYYYYCGHNGNPRGYVCNYKAKLRTTDIEPYVVEAIKELIRGESFAKEIESRIGQKANTEAIDIELRNYKKRLIETETNKANLEETIDNLPLDIKYRERKLKDMSARLDSLYDTINELEECIKDASLRRAAMEEEVLTLDNVYKLLLSFDKIYDIMSDKEKKDLISYLIKDIQIYSNEEQVEMPLKSITLNFPIYSDSGEVNKLLWENRDGVETLVVLSKKIADSHINIDVEFGECEGQFSLKKIKERAEARKPKEKVTYKKMKDYIEQTYGFKVHTAYIAEVKRDLGLPMYDAPNAVEELKRPRAHPTPKMVEAIKETLKHFEII